MKSSATVLVVAIGLLLAACGDPGPEADTSSSTASTPPSTIMGSSTTTETSMPNQSDLAFVAVADLATRLAIGEEDVEVLRVESVTWPDAAIGCPEEGEMYAQVIVEGTRVLLQVGERIYDYHAGDDDMIFLCPSEERDGGYDFVPPPGDPER